MQKNTVSSHKKNEMNKQVGYKIIQKHGQCFKHGGRATEEEEEGGRRQV